MDNLELLKQIAVDFAEAIKGMFPDYTSATIMVDANGLLHIDATKWEDHHGLNENEISRAKRRELLLLTNNAYGIGWDERSDVLNEHFKECGTLLEV